MNTIQVVNIKCGGCAKNITGNLGKLGCSNIMVDVANQSISFEGGDIEVIKIKLAKMGYPEASSPEAKSALKKAKSFVSCAIGKMQ